MGGEPSALAAKAATATTPIVFVVGGDPLRSGIVTGLHRPGANMTGVSLFISELEPKRLELLRELVPAAARIAVLINPANAASAEPTMRDVEAAARAMSLQIQFHNASPVRRSNRPSQRSRASGPTRFSSAATLFSAAGRVQLVNLASRHAIPTSFANREATEIGGLMSYGTDLLDMYRQVGVYTGRILKGANPANLPVEQPTKFDFVINLTTAKALGVKISDNLLSLAD